MVNSRVMSLRQIDRVAGDLIAACGTEVRRLFAFPWNAKLDGVDFAEIKLKSSFMSSQYVR